MRTLLLSAWWTSVKNRSTIICVGFPIPQTFSQNVSPTPELDRRLFGSYTTRQEATQPSTIRAFLTTVSGIVLSMIACRKKVEKPLPRRLLSWHGALWQKWLPVWAIRGILGRLVTLLWYHIKKFTCQDTLIYGQPSLKIFTFGNFCATPCPRGMAL